MMSKSLFYLLAVCLLALTCKVESKVFSTRTGRSLLQGSHHLPGDHDFPPEVVAAFAEAQAKASSEGDDEVEASVSTPSDDDDEDDPSPPPPSDDDDEDDSPPSGSEGEGDDEPEPTPEPEDEPEPTPEPEDEPEEPEDEPEDGPEPEPKEQPTPEPEDEPEEPEDEPEDEPEVPETPVVVSAATEEPMEEDAEEPMEEEPAAEEPMDEEPAAEEPMDEEPAAEEPMDEVVEVIAPETAPEIVDAVAPEAMAPGPAAVVCENLVDALSQRSPAITTVLNSDVIPEALMSQLEDADATVTVLLPPEEDLSSLARTFQDGGITQAELVAALSTHILTEALPSGDLAELDGETLTTANPEVSLDVGVDGETISFTTGNLTATVTEADIDACSSSVIHEISNIISDLDLSNESIDLGNRDIDLDAEAGAFNLAVLPAAIASVVAAVALVF